MSDGLIKSAKGSYQKSLKKGNGPSGFYDAGKSLANMFEAIANTFQSSSEYSDSTDLKLVGEDGKYYYKRIGNYKKGKNDGGQRIITEKEYDDDTTPNLDDL